MSHHGGEFYPDIDWDLKTNVGFLANRMGLLSELTRYAVSERRKKVGEDSTHPPNQQWLSCHLRQLERQ